MDSRYYTVLREFRHMEPVTMVVIGLALIVCAYMAWNIGANDVANAMGTSVGSRALTLKQAVIIAAIFEFAGAFFAGDAVTKTVRKGILTVDFSTVTPDISHDIAFGFIAAMMAAAVWLTIATRFGLPVSTTHSIIGGIIGVGLVLEVDHNAEYIDWGVVQTVVMSWVASPLMGALIAFFSYYIIKKLILDSNNPEERSMWLAPILAFPTFFVLGLALQFKALKGFFAKAESNGWIADKYAWIPAKENGVWNPFEEAAWLPINSLILAATIGAIGSVCLYLVLQKIDIKQESNGFRGVERIFVWLQIITAAYVAFAHGANDRSNAIGPMAAVWQVLSNDTGMLMEKAEIPLWLVLLGSAGIAIGVRPGDGGLWKPLERKSPTLRQHVVSQLNLVLLRPFSFSLCRSLQFQFRPRTHWSVLLLVLDSQVVRRPLISESLERLQPLGLRVFPLLPLVQQRFTSLPAVMISR